MPEVTGYKEAIKEIMDDWSNLKFGAFNKIVKSRGLVPKGLSKAQGLEGGADWNRELANVLSPGFGKWSEEQPDHRRRILGTLAKNFNLFHSKIDRTITNAAANVPTVEKAKQKWEPLRRRVLVKLETLMDEVEHVHSRMFEWATMEYGRQSSLVSNITDSIFDEVFKAVPPLKPINPKAKKPKQQYVMPKTTFQKAKLSEKLLTPDNHFVEQAINLFQSELDKRVRHTIDQNFAAIEALYDRFDTGIRAQGPISYKLRPDGKAIRAEVKERIPELQERIDQLKTFLPTQANQDDSAEDQSYNVGAEEDDGYDFATTDNNVSKRKNTAPSEENRPSKAIKHEPF